MRAHTHTHSHWTSQPGEVLRGSSSTVRIWHSAHLTWLSFLGSFFFFFGLFVFLGLHPQHMEVPRLGVESEPQQHQIQAESVTYTTAQGNTTFLTHCARPGTEPATSWFLVGFVSISPRQELLTWLSFKYLNKYAKISWCCHTFLWVIDHATWKLQLNRDRIIVLVP